MGTELGLTLAIAGAAVVATLSGIGSSIGVNIAARISTGILSEEPEKFGSLLILSAIPGTQGVYGFLLGFLIILKIGLLTGNIAQITTNQGMQIFFTALPVASVEFFSAIFQGKVAAGGAGIVAKKPESFISGVILAVLVEFYAVLGLLIGIFLIQNIKLG